MLFVAIFAGPLAPGTWLAAGGACAIKCAAAGPAYAACLAACYAIKGPIASLFCFSEHTIVQTPES